jgi:hypothetical protein
MAVQRWGLSLARVLDLAAGSGEATLALRECGAGTIDACDPFLFEQYQRRTGRSCERFSFEDVAVASAEDLLRAESNRPGVAHPLAS